MLARPYLSGRASMQRVQATRMATPGSCSSGLLLLQLCTAPPGGLQVGGGRLRSKALPGRCRCSCTSGLQSTRRLNKVPACDTG